MLGFICGVSLKCASLKFCVKIIKKKKKCLYSENLLSTQN